MKSDEQMFKAVFISCALCGRCGYPGPGLELHHIVGGAQRSGPGHRRENWLMLCKLCHSHHHQGGHFFDDGEKMPEILRGHLVWCKQQADPGYYSMRVLKVLLRGKEDIRPEQLQAVMPHERYLAMIGFVDE